MAIGFDKLDVDTESERLHKLIPFSNLKTHRILR